MKKIEISNLENLDGWEKKVFDFLKEFNLENISKLNIVPRGNENQNSTFFRFETKTGAGVEFFYMGNQKIQNVSVWKGEGLYLDLISISEHEEDEKKERWLNSIWEQFVDYFNLRIRLMFISKTAPWNWKTEFIY